MNSFTKLVFIIDTSCVLFEVRTKILNVISTSFSFNRVRMYSYLCSGITVKLLCFNVLYVQLIRLCRHQEPANYCCK
jgi:hypothetical protein